MQKKFLEYKGLFGSLEFSSYDQVFHGKILGVSDMILFEGATMEELEKDFHNAADDYLDDMASFPYDWKPAFPGEILQEEFLTPLGLTRKQCADSLGVEVEMINNICEDRSAITPEIALKLFEVFGVSTEFWLKAQTATNLWDMKKANHGIDNP